MIYTAESVSAWHPDKVCDQISDAILDECLKQDPDSRVAVETMGGHGMIHLTGEITTKADFMDDDFKRIARDIYQELFGKDIIVTSNIEEQSPDIAQGVNTGGAGDQGIMIGYAYQDTESHLPPELDLCRKLLAPFKKDAKSQVTIDAGEVSDVVLSVQDYTQDELFEYITKFKEIGRKANVYCNNTGSFDIGGFDADAGVTGRKIVIDQYGPRVPVGGGAFSGKDPTKVDRSGAYMARFIALSILKDNPSAKDVYVRLAYVIGKAEPTMAVYKINGMEFHIDQNKFDCRPDAIIERFDLKRPMYLETARNGHFGVNHYPWERV